MVSSASLTSPFLDAFRSCGRKSAWMGLGACGIDLPSKVCAVNQSRVATFAKSLDLYVNWYQWVVSDSLELETGNLPKDLPRELVYDSGQDHALVILPPDVDIPDRWNGWTPFKEPLHGSVLVGSCSLYRRPCRLAFRARKRATRHGGNAGSLGRGLRQPTRHNLHGVPRTFERAAEQSPPHRSRLRLCLSRAALRRLAPRVA